MRALRVGTLSIAVLVACGDPPSGGQTVSDTASDASASDGAVTDAGAPTTATPTTTADETTGQPGSASEVVTAGELTTTGEIGETGETTAETEGSCPEGQQGCPCDQDGACVDPLECVAGVCEPATPASCGDGVLDPGEQCDAGPDNSDTGACKPDCTHASCGDGRLGPGEQCDQGADNSDTGACKLDCTAASCGDGHVGPGEPCDDGNRVDDDACSNDCAPASCGDGEPGPGEDCDDGNAIDTDACTSACAAATCGDGLVHAGVEGCDQGAQNSDAGACTLACQPATCGDGKLHAGVEQCDDGNAVNTDACTAACESAACGDGHVQPGEQCDDGNATAGDGCEANCEPTPQQMNDACGFPADDGVWFEIDYSNAFTVTNPAWTFSPTPGWGEADWAPQGESWPEVWDVFNNASVANDQIGKVALLNGTNKAVQVMFGIAGLTYDYATVCVQGRSYSVGSSVTFTAQNQLNQCGDTGMLSNSWEVHKAGVDLGTCIVQNGEFQGLRVFPSSGSGALSLKKLRLTLHGAAY